MLLHNSYINTRIVNKLLYCKGLYNHQKSRNARLTCQERQKSGGFSINHHEIEEKYYNCYSLIFLVRNVWSCGYSSIKWLNLRPVLVCYLPLELEYNRVHI